MNIPFDTGVSAPSPTTPSPTTPPPSGDPNAVIAAFAKAVMSRESGGRTNAISPQGATGSMQIMPDTFKQYAAPGEVYENDSHRTNAALRKIVDDYQFYKGDLAKVAAAYIGGRGAVRPDGTIRTDVRDALGTTPAAYSQQVLARMGAVPSAAQPAAERGPDIGINAAGDTLYVNGQLFKVDDRGRALQLLRDGTMTRSGEGKLPPGFSQPPAGSVEAYLTRIVPSSATGKAFTAGVENWKGGYNELFGAGQQIFGVDPANNTGMQRADVNKRYASELAALNPLPQKFDDAQGVVGVGQYTYGKLLESMPYLAEMLGGGLVGKLVQVGVRAGAPVAVQAAGRAAYEAAMAKGMGEAAAQAAAKKGMQEFGSAIPMIAGVAASYPSGVGDVLGNMREETPGSYDVGAAAALGVPYAALNAIGGGAAAVNLLTRGTVRGAGLAAAVPGVAGRVARGAVAAGITGEEEAAGEYGQEWLNQAGRRAVNPAYDFGSPEAVAARRESAIAGGLVGAAVGGAGGAATRAQAAQPRDLINPPAEPVATPAVPGEPFPPNAGPTGDARLFAPVPIAPLDASPLVPAGNLDYRAEPSPFTGVRAPLVTPDQAAAMQQTAGVAQPPVSSFVPAEPLRGGIDPTGAVSPQEVMIQQDAGAAQVPVATPSATGAQVQGGGTWDAADLSNAVRVPMPETKRTTSVVRQRPARVKRTAGETEGPRVDTGPVSGSTEQGQVVTATLPENETGGITPASPVNLRRGERGNTPIIDGGTSQRGEARARGETAAPAAQAAPKVETKAEAPTDEQVSELEAEVSRILAAKKSEGAPLPTKRKPPKEPTRGEEVKARQLGKKIHEAFENSPDMPEVVTAAHRAGTIAQRLGGASMFASLSKIGQAAKDAGGWFAVPLTKGAAGRVANDTVERASAIERVFQQFDQWVEKHGVAGVNEFFKYRKANNLEMTADEAVSYAEGEEEVGDVKGKERYANAVLSNLWRLYRSGKFNDNPFGLTSDTRGEVRGRKEADGTAKRLMGWFDGTQQPPWKGGWGTLKGENTGMVRLATYFRFHGRSNLTNLLGSALARVFRASRVDVDFKMVSGSAVTVDGTTYGGLYLHASKAKPVTVETQDGKVTISKPTILMPTESVNEELVLHEMLHAATVNGITPSARAGMKRIIDALRESKPKDGRAHRAWNAITGTKDEFEAVMELISYGFTDNAFQQYMKDVKMPARKSVASKLGTVFEYFVNMVKLALGVHNARTSALGQFIEEGFGALRAAEQGGKKTSRGFLGTARDGRYEVEKRVNTTTGEVEVWSSGKIVASIQFATPKLLSNFSGDALDRVVRQRLHEKSAEIAAAVRDAEEAARTNTPLNRYEKAYIEARKTADALTRKKMKRKLTAAEAGKLDYASYIVSNGNRHNIRESILNNTYEEKSDTFGSRKFDFRTGNQVRHKGMNKTGVVTAVKPTPFSYDLIDFKDTEGNTHTVKDYELEYHWRGPRQGSLFGAVKEKGGAWAPSNLAEWVSRGIYEKLDDMSGYKTDENGDFIEKPLFTWADKKVTAYLKKYAGTKEDPLNDVRLGRVRWEDMMDRLVHSDEIRDVLEPEKINPRWRENPREPVWSVWGELDGPFSAGGAAGLLRGFLQHVGDYLEANVPVDKLQQYDFVRAAKETVKWDEDMKRQAEKANEDGMQWNLEQMKTMPVYKDYGNGWKWVQLTRPGEFAWESTTMGHSVRGYEPWTNLGEQQSAHPDWTERSEFGLPKGEPSSGYPEYGEGGWEAIKNDRVRIYSLRDPKGKSHATAEVSPTPMTDGDENIILQLKGKYNSLDFDGEVKQYVDDFTSKGDMILVPGITHGYMGEAGGRGQVFGSLPAQAESVVPVSELKAPTRIVEQMYKTLIQTSLPFMYREGADGKTAFENFVDKGKSRLLSYVKDNHPDVALHLQGFAGDLFMPAPYKASLDVMRHVGHQAAMDIDKMYTAIGKLDRAQEEKLHAYMMSKGELDGFSDEQKKVAAEFRMAVNRFMADAREAGVLPEWTKDVSIGDIIQWVEKDSVRIPSGVKASNAFKLAKYHRKTINDNGVVQGDNKAGYHALYDAETIVGFVPVGTTEADARTQLDLDANAVLETGKLWRMESSKDGKATMIHTPTFAEKRDAMKAASYMDALALTVHTLAHDTGVTQVANSLASDENMNTKGGLAYSDVELLKEHEGEHAVVEDSNVNKTQQRLARTPGYWTKLGSGYGKLSGTYVPGPVYAALTDYASTQSIFGPTYGRILQLWKENKTSLSPGTHISNVMSSFVMAYMHDIPASTIMHAFEIARGKDGNEHAMAVWKEFEKSGALLSSYRSSELANTVVQKLEQEVARRAGVKDSASGLVKLLEAWERSKAAALVKGGREAAAHLYEMEDNVFRLAAYMEFVRRETGKPDGMRGEELIRAGGKFAADAMINYSINAKYINKLRSSILPFLAWPYRAIPMLANMALFQPWKLATVVTYVYALNALAYAIDGGDEDEERKRLPEWNKGNVWGMPGMPKMLRMPFSADGKPAFVNLSAYMPLGNINTDTASGLPSTLLPGGPVWTAVEILLGHNSFTGQPINRPAQSAGEKTANVLDFAWEAWAPGVPLPFNREGDKLADLWRGKHGVGGEPAEPITSVLSALGPKIVAVDLHEQEVRTALATRALAREFQTEVRRVAREEYRYESPDVEKVREKQAALVERFHEKLLKLKGEK